MAQRAASEPEAFVRPYEAADQAAVVEVLLAAFDAEPVPGTSRAEVAWSTARIDADPGSTIVAIEDGRVVGACTPRADALAVHPDHRRRGHGRRLVAAAQALVGRRGLPELQLWGDADRPAAGAFIRALGFTYRSSLWMLVLPGQRRVPAATFPAEIAVRPVHPGIDDPAFTALLNAVFADHPSPLSWPESYIRQIHARPDFDPAGVLVLAPADDPSRLVGLCRTVVLPADSGPGRGEIAVVGLLPEWRGRGLGRQLLRWGVGYLRGLGFEEIELTVEARNARALELYHHEGFEDRVEWPHWVLPAT